MSSGFLHTLFCFCVILWQILIVFYQINSVKVVLLHVLCVIHDIAFIDEANTGTAGGTELSWYRHELRFHFRISFQFTSEADSSKMSMECCDISQDRSILFFEFPHSIINAEHSKCQCRRSGLLFGESQNEIVAFFFNRNFVAAVGSETGYVFFCGGVVNQNFVLFLVGRQSVFGHQNRLWAGQTACVNS